MGRLFSSFMTEGLTGICRIYPDSLFQVKESADFTSERTEWGTQIEFDGLTLDIALQ